MAPSSPLQRAAQEPYQRPEEQVLINRRDITSRKVRLRLGLQPVRGLAAILTPMVTPLLRYPWGNRPSG